jgi:20S proteasome subunit alpha 6
VNNTSIGILGPISRSEEKPVVDGAFRILENSAVDPFLKTMIPKDTAAPTTAPAHGGDADVQMSG